MIPPSKLIYFYQRRFCDGPHWTVRAPGRVNLIGEHTDYNDGLVLPMAIDHTAWIALRARADRQVILHSIDFDQTIEFHLDRINREGIGWGEYIKGVAWAIQDAGFHLNGWEGVLTGDIPRGAGLSSSAAVELATAHAFTAVSDLALDPVKLALLCQKAENRWIGVNCGIMDQMASAAAKEGHALFIDCQSLEHKHILLPKGVSVAILDTSTRRGLVDSEYNRRRDQCETAARLFGVTTLRDVDPDTFHTGSSRLDEVTYRRARHVISENIRVLEAIDALEANNTDNLGKLLNASHTSLRDDFEVSNEALDTIVDIARAEPGCFGARMTGAGFGGCAIALISQECRKAFSDAVSVKYLRATGLTPMIYITQAASGACAIKE
ncbi:MAG: galactokinase [Chloroflexota bacterium]